MTTPASRPQPVRGTQSFVRTLSYCWTHPGLTGLEVLWRWLYGIPAVLIVVNRVRGILMVATDGTLDPARLGLDHALLNDPVGALTADPMSAAGKFAGALGLVLPQMLHAGMWLAPLLLGAWVVVSSIGRTAVLRRADARLTARPWTLMILQSVRIAALAASFAIWYRALLWSSQVAITTPIAAGSEPNLVLYCALIIVLTIGLFILWSLVSWWFGVAPLLAMLNDSGAIASLRAAGRLGHLKGKLIEINLVMGIVKIALLVLAMVFSATPLPFQSVTTPEFLPGGGLE